MNYDRYMEFLDHERQAHASERLQPTPETPNCPFCSVTLTICIDDTRYYTVMEVKEGNFIAAYETMEGSDERLFCSGCNLYFIMPEHYDLEG